MRTPKHPPQEAGNSDKSDPTYAMGQVDAFIDELSRFPVSRVRERWDSSLESLKSRINETLADIFGAGTPGYDRYAVDAFDTRLSESFDNLYTTEELQQAIREGLDAAIVNMESLKRLLGERAKRQVAKVSESAPAVSRPEPEPEPKPKANTVPVSAPAPSPLPVTSVAPPVVPAPPAASATSASASTLRVAVVCHRDTAVREATLGFLAQLGMQASTVPEPPGMADSAFFEGLERLGPLDYAIVHVGNDAALNALSAEQLLELGFLVRAVGRHRICFLAAGNMTALPPWEGVARVPMDEAGGWLLLLARAMKQAGLAVDMNRAL